MTAHGATIQSAPDAVGLVRDRGTVITYEAELQAGVKVVVKRLVAEKVALDPVGSQRFRREMRLISVLKHSALPQLVASGQDWFALERLEGSLAIPQCAARFCDPENVRALLEQLADVLAYIHARGVVHRDIKPAHVMFRGEFPVLIDFGVAGLIADDPLACLEIAGTPAWMAPEQLFGGGGPEADIWSLCALGLWLLSGTRPFNGDIEEILTKRHRGATPEFDLPSGASRNGSDLLGVLQSGLGAAEARPTSATLLRFLSIR